MGGERYHSQQVCVRGLAHTDLCSTCSHVSFKFQRNNREIAQQLFKMIKFCLQLGIRPRPDWGDYDAPQIPCSRLNKEST